MKTSLPLPALDSLNEILEYDNKQKHLGTFSTMLEAYERRLREELRIASKTNDSVLRAKASAELYRLKRGT